MGWRKQSFRRCPRAVGHLQVGRFERPEVRGLALAGLASQQPGMDADGALPVDRAQQFGGVLLGLRAPAALGHEADSVDFAVPSGCRDVVALVVCKR